MVKIITKFSAYHDQLRNILSKHWLLLTDHHILNKHVHNTLEPVFRRASSLKDYLKSSHYQPSVSRPLGQSGAFQCGQCPCCPWILTGTTYRLPNGELFTLHTPAHCGTTGVIYLMLCDCKAFYVGKTIRELRQRIGNHLYYSTNGKLTTIGRHIGLYHRFNPRRQIPGP